MKQTLNSKNVLLAATLLFCGAFANAQSASNGEAWSTSKGVQKIANKEVFSDENLKNSHIAAVSVIPTWNIAKGVYAMNSSDLGKGNIASTGYPSWTISKGVQRVSNPEAAVNPANDAQPNDPAKMVVSKGVHQLKRK